MGLSGHSSSKVVNFVHESFTSIVSNLNKVQEAKYMAQQVEVNKFQRMIAGFDIPTPTSSRPEVVVFCKKCVTAARRDLNNQEGEVARANPSVRLFDNDTYPASADEGGFRPSNAGKASNQSSSTSTSSLQKLTAERSSILSDRAPLYVGTTIPMSSAGEVPMSPLSVRTEREKRRSRLETDPMESYDGFDNHAYGAQSEDQFEEGIRESCSSYSSYKYGSDRRGSQEARDNDMASRLREISQRAQEALEVTKRNSCMMSDTSSAPRMSDLAAFKELDKSIAEQADLLNVIGLVSTGRVYLENNGPEQGGVRVSESSSIMSEDERFEVIT
ncbi:hypothetical protein ON010_g10203 [Phytophthora cinnamomi]|nr:hypothetical protein ON010_g10203 [Phytophthora cinnamomi]